MKTTTTTKKTSKAKQTNKQTLNNKDPNKTRTHFDIKISILYQPMYFVIFKLIEAISSFLGVK